MRCALATSQAYDDVPLESSLAYVDLATAMADDVVNFYNPARRRSSLNYLTPDEFELLTTLNPARTLIGVAH